MAPVLKMPLQEGTLRREEADPGSQYIKPFPCRWSFAGHNTLGTSAKKAQCSPSTDEGGGQQGEITPMKEKLEPRPEGTISSVGGNELQGDPRPRRPPALKVEAGSKSISMGSGPSNPPSMVRFSCASPLASLFCTHTVDTCSQRPFRSSPHSCKMSPLLLHPLSYRLCY